MKTLLETCCIVYVAPRMEYKYKTARSEAMPYLVELHSN